MTSTESSDRRRWWREHLGAEPDPHGQWTLADHPGYAGFEVAGRFRTVSLSSYGSTLDAALFQPDDGVAGAVVIVPFYDTPSVFGRPSPRTERTGRIPRHPLGTGLARAGLSVLAVPWWFETRATKRPDTAHATDLAGRYGPPAQEHTARLSITPLGRSVGDLMLAVRALLEEELAEPGRLGVLGHSLGGKLALHLGALDARVDAVASHEPGLGFAFSNWRDAWYLGEKVPADRDQDELAALVAPRPLLWAGGGDSDGEHNRHLLDGVAAAWSKATKPEVLVHNNGHPMPAHVVAACSWWLHDHLARP